MLNILFFIVRAKGLEPPRLTAPDPKSGAATNYATRAMLLGLASAKIGKKMELPNFYCLFILKERQNAFLRSFLSNKQLSMNMSVS